MRHRGLHRHRAAVGHRIRSWQGEPQLPGPPGAEAPQARTRTRRRQLSPFVSLANYLTSRQGSITAAVYDKRTGQTWVYRGLAQDTASIVKVEIMGTALWEAQTAGTPLSATSQSLMLPMIENSDNDAATSMLANVGGPSASRKFDRIGRAHRHDALHAEATSRERRCPAGA